MTKFKVGDKVVFNSSRYGTKELQEGQGTVIVIGKTTNNDRLYRVNLTDKTSFHTWSAYLESELSLLEENKIEVGDIVRLKESSACVTHLPSSLVGLEAEVIRLSRGSEDMNLVKVVSKDSGLAISERYIYNNEMELVCKAGYAVDRRPRLEALIKDKEIAIIKSKFEVRILQDDLNALIRAKELLEEWDER